MDVTAKLQIKPGQLVAALAADSDVPSVVTPDANPSADPGSADAIKKAITAVTNTKPLESDIDRVRARLAAGGWPLADLSRD